MKAIPHIAKATTAKSGCVVAKSPTSTHTNPTATSGSPAGETLETIANRATTVTIVLQQIRSYGAGHPYQRGGLNE